jgi:hypothetical protein
MYSSGQTNTEQSSTNQTKVNLIIYLAKKLRNEVSIAGIADPIVLRLIVVLNYVVIVLFKVKGTTKSKNTPLHLSVILRLLVRLKNLYSENKKESDFHKYLREQHPDVYKSVITKQIDPNTAYDWCSKNSDKNRDFSHKLQELVSADEYYNINEGSWSLNEEQIFIRELVRIIARYKAAGVIITSLNRSVLKLKSDIDSLEIEKNNLENTISGLIRVGPVDKIVLLIPVPDNIEQESIPTEAVDGSGVGCTLQISNGEVTVEDGGSGYKVNDIISFELILSVSALSHVNMGIKALLQYSNQENEAVVAKYYIKIQNIVINTSYATNIGLEELLFEVPIWTRIYNNISPNEFDIDKLTDLKNSIENYDVQYAILKHGTSDDNFDTSFV